MKYYLAYGSNLNLKAMAKRCPSAVKVGSFRLAGYKLVCWQYLNLIPNSNSSVEIGVFSYAKEDEHLLDEYEDYPNLYYKEMIPFMLNGKKEIGLIYFMKKKSLQKPTDEYIIECMEGYRDFNFDLNYLNGVFKEQ